MEISPRKTSKRMQEPVDEWLQNEGFFRKHAPKDPTCLFRAFSEQVYNTQLYHIRVRKECVEFMYEMRYLFEQNITVPYESYLEQMACFTEWGGFNEIQAMSLLYKKEVIVFNAQKQTYKTVTANGFKDIIYLCHIPPKQYESIYTKEYIGTAAFCQSIVYQTLYKDVFNMSNIEETVYKMLHDRTSNFRHDKFFQKGNLGIREQLRKEIYKVAENGDNEIEETQSSCKVVTPFPYRVAKALDPYIYRNTDFDIWHEIKREVKNAGWTRHNSNELQVGGKCLIQMDFDENDFDRVNNNDIYVDTSHSEKDQNGNEEKTMQRNKKESQFYYGHIQEMSKNNGPVIVFIEDLGEKRAVPYDALKPLPVRKMKQSTWQPMCRRNVLVDSNQKWKKGNGNLRRMKDTIDAVSGSLNHNERNCNNSIHNNNLNKKDVCDWKDEASKENHVSFSNYTRDQGTNYGINVSQKASTNVFPTVLGTSKSHVVKSIQQDIIEGHKESMTYIKNNNDDECTDKNNTNTASVTTETSIQVYTHSKQRLQKEVYYPPGSGSSNLCYLNQDGNPYSVLPYIPINLGEPITSSQMDRILRYLNSSAQKSVDTNNSDLPFSDPFALRFFYNLGLEYFRASHALNFSLNGQATSYCWYNGQANATLNVQQSREDSEADKSNILENDSKSKDIGKQTSLPKASTAGRGISKSETLSGETQQNDVNQEKSKDYETFNKDLQRANKNTLAPRFKKNSDPRYRNNSQQSNSQQQQPQHPRTTQYFNANYTSQNIQEGNNDNTQGQHSNQMMTPQAQVFSQGYAPYIQQNMYGTIPCFIGESEGFGSPCYVPNAPFHPVPFITHPDITESNNQASCFSHVCPGTENYPQTYPPPYPYMISQQVPYANVQLNMQESWFPAQFPPPPQYYPYTVVSPNGESSNAVDQNIQNPQSVQNMQSNTS